MSLREHLNKLEKEGSLLQISKPVSKRLEAAGILKAVEPRPVLFENIKDSEYRIMGNLFCGKKVLLLISESKRVRLFLL